ncbi:MAG: energy-coupling factor transporter transmembrane protein EcfT [Defluviitaleaceae bacterium]|nr:energy-coupling factor transporter transmembrane protein EcfT [Defluviitaleaceae bacterium]
MDNTAKNLPDPRIIFALVFATSTFAVIIRSDTVAMAGLLLITIICGLVLGVNFIKLSKRLKRLLQVMVIITLLQSIFRASGPVILYIGNFPLLTAGGVAMGVLVAFRFLIFLAGAFMFTLYPVRSLIQGMVQIKMPYELAYMVSIGIRFIPQFAESMQDSLTALQLRGMVFEELKFKKRMSIYSYLLLPTLMSALKQARELANSMDMRAFRANPKRTTFYTLRFKARDWVLLFCVALATGAITFAIFRYNFFTMIFGF